VSPFLAGCRKARILQLDITHVLVHGSGRRATPAPS
jgi:hypothetical protein